MHNLRSRVALAAFVVCIALFWVREQVGEIWDPYVA
jgi:hypothetical protein